MSNIKLLQDAMLQIQSSTAILITAGAGMGVDSGLPDFRGSEGFWRAYPIAKKLGYEFEDMANPDLFEKDPNLAWGFYGHRLNLYRNTTPHKGFEILRNLCIQKGEDNYFIYTSNVDGQFQEANFDENKIVECHGSIHYLQCLKACDRSDIWSTDGINIIVDEEKLLASNPLPACQVCRKLARPNILMFGDCHFNRNRVRQQQDKFENWINQKINNKQKIAIIEIGAGIAIPTIRNLSEKVAKENNNILIRINLRESKAPKDHIGIQMKALEALESF